MTLPFDGEISRYFKEDAPTDVRDAIENSDRKAILTDEYPYDDRMDSKLYQKILEALQIELVKLQSHVKKTGARVAVVLKDVTPPEKAAR